MFLNIICQTLTDDLLEGGYHIAGEIFIDGCNIKDLDLRFLRRNIGVVSQEPSFFTGTINDNLKIGNTNANDEMLQKAAKTANIHSFISELPERYATEVRIALCLKLKPLLENHVTFDVISI